MQYWKKIKIEIVPDWPCLALRIYRALRLFIVFYKFTFHSYFQYLPSPLLLFARSVCFMLATSLWTHGPVSHHLLWKPPWSQETCASYLIPLLMLFWSSDHIKCKQKPPHLPKGMPASTKSLLYCFRNRKIASTFKEIFLFLCHHV